MLEFFLTVSVCWIYRLSILNKIICLLSMLSTKLYPQSFIPRFKLHVVHLVGSRYLICCPPS